MTTCRVYCKFIINAFWHSFCWHWHQQNFWVSEPICLTDWVTWKKIIRGYASRSEMQKVFSGPTKSENHFFSSWQIVGHLIYHSCQSNTHYIWKFAHFCLTTGTQKYCEKRNSWKSIFEWRSWRDRNCFDVWWFNHKCCS